MVSNQSKYHRMADGLNAKVTAIKALIAKKRENQQEDNKGFSQGGSSEEVKEKGAGIKEELAMLEQELRDAEKQKEINDLFLQQNITKENEQANITELAFNEPGAADEFARSIADKYGELGFKVSLTREGNKLEVKVEMPLEFMGHDPLAMSSKELQEMRKASQKAVPTGEVTPREIYNVAGVNHEIGGGRGG